MIIFLIEDEILALEELEHLLVPYSEHHTIRCFASGEKAVLHTQKEVPDIVISDIRMPRLSGLETLQKLLVVNPQLQAIMLSGYTDFEYARTALKLGAKEYLLKPVSTKELYNLLDRLIETVKLEEQKNQMAMDWSFNRMIRGINKKDNKNNLDKLDGDWIMVATLLENWNSDSTWSGIGLYESEVMDWVQLRFQQQSKCFDVDGHLRIFLLPMLAIEKESITRQKIQQIHEYLLASNKVIHTVYHLKKGNESLESVYHSNIHLLEKQVKIGIPTFMTEEQASNLTLVWDSARLIEKHILESEYAKLNIELRRMLDNLKRTGVPMKQSSIFLTDFVYAIKFNLSKNKSDLDPVSMESVYDLLKTCEDYSKLHDWLLAKLSGMMKEVASDLNQPKQVIPSLLDYVQQHYSDTIYLQDFAAKHHMSVSHLSKMFKAETGSNFSDYILQVRMMKAQELLDGGYKKISEISKLVGYEDPKFFSQIFKRWSGVTPNEYKKKDN
ncbi:hypothetical protein A8709_13300 [Paenibacillus pectinilyticus]|uniref:DNA-binding response regulator n=1 Tax=Paenibacillus pectinilyticus TaxID=512399 RepID=A0A1C1A3F5_9BACL|nr:response regulator [Paenibacillus pectinilyticus]OCT15083.1 hypothetical protein A8709_13300 [Paenibacillus pectinilyticus]